MIKSVVLSMEGSWPSRRLTGHEYAKLISVLPRLGAHGMAVDARSRKVPTSQ